MRIILNFNWAGFFFLGLTGDRNSQFAPLTCVYL